MSFLDKIIDYINFTRIEPNENANKNNFYNIFFEYLLRDLCLSRTVYTPTYTVTPILYLG